MRAIQRGEGRVADVERGRTRGCREGKEGTVLVMVLVADVVLAMVLIENVLTLLLMIDHQPELKQTTTKSTTTPK